MQNVKDRHVSCWNKRTNLEKILLTMLGLISIITICIIIVSVVLSLQINPSREASAKVCSSPECIHAASNALQYIDESINPCDDFYEFACGTFLKENDIPDDETSVDPTFFIQKVLDVQLRTIIEEAPSSKDSRPFQLLQRFYNICMDTSAIENHGVDTLISTILKDVGGWPVLERNHWKKDQFDWIEFIKHSRKYGYSFDALLSMSVEVDGKNSSKYILSLFEPAMLLSRETFMQGISHKPVEDYYNFIVDLAVILGADKIFAAKELKDCVEFEIELSKISSNPEDMRNVTASYNPMTIAALEGKYPNIPWLTLINTVINVPEITIGTNEIIDLTSPDYVNKLIPLINRTPQRVLVNYAVLNVVLSSVTFLTEEVRNREQEYYKTSSGLREKSPRWKDCIAISELGFGFVLAQMYVRKHFDEDAKRDVTEMVADLHTELNKMLQEEKWIGQSTKAKALEKVKAMKFHVGYSNELLNDKTLEDYYSNLNITSNDFLLCAQELMLFKQKVSFTKLRKLIDKNDWTTLPLPTIVNAMYYPEDNRIGLPAGILQGIFFNKYRPRYMNYGGIGSVIGHEIIHGFDDQGRQYDQHGNLQDWWDTETENAFLERANCIIEQYSKIVVPEVNQNINGNMTQGENIADNGGIKLAYAAYQSWVARNGEEPLLPGLIYTPNQMFWISAAHGSCTKTRTETLEQYLSENAHAPERFRVQIPFSNTESFAKDFNCPLGSNMNPKEKCLLW